MKAVTPQVRIVGRMHADDDEIARYLESIDAHNFGKGRMFASAEDLVEFAGRMCYRSWEPGLNPNVTKVREDQAEYLQNILAQEHGSVLEHATWTFVFQDVSRVLTHELVRHRVGTAISQESMRYVRLNDLPFWFPDWAQQDTALYHEAQRILIELEVFQGWMTRHFRLDDPGQPFVEKKHKTSFMRRFAPSGHATSLTWTANARTLRHVIETRTAPGAEEEIRMVFDQVARMMQRESKILFGDFEEQANGSWLTKWSKV